MAKLPDTFVQRLRWLEQRLNDFEQAASKIQFSLSDDAKSASPSKVMRGLERAADALAGPIRQMLADNYRTSGIGNSPRSKDSGKQGNRLPHNWLKKMIAATTVKLVAKAAYGDGTLVPTFEINLGGPGAKTQERVVAASLNWGAQHVGMTMRAPVNPADMLKVPEAERAAAGAAAKRSLKKLALANTISAKAYKAVRRGATFKGVQLTRGLDVKRNSRYTKKGGRAIHLGPAQKVWTAIPYPFFYFTPAQMTAIKNVVVSAIEQEIQNGR